MKLVTPEQMRRLDRAAIEEHGIPSLTLMERAGQGVADSIARMPHASSGPIGILVGRGNNGGDGLVAARLLIEDGRDAILFMASPRARMSDDARANWERLVPLAPRVIPIDDTAGLEAGCSELARCSLLIDALLGTGLSKELSGHMRDVVDVVNRLETVVVAVDVPTGLDASSGEPLGEAIRARCTLTLGLPKIGLLRGKGPEYSGRVEVIDIGIPRAEMERIDTPWELITPELFASWLMPRAKESHKGTYGHALIVAGSHGRLGAGYLASLACLRMGTGLVTYALPEGAFDKFDARYPEIMCQSIPDGGKGHLTPDGVAKTAELVEGKDAVAIGPAIGTDPSTVSYVRSVVGETDRPMVIDADGLNCLTGHPGVIEARRAPTIITPHPGEMGRLAGRTAAQVQEDRIATATEFARSHRVHVVLKGFHTIVATPDGRAFINQTGNPGMATAGTGDALTGMIAGLLAMGQEPLKAAATGVYLHGAAGDLAASGGEAGMIASDLVDRIPAAIADVGREIVG